MVNLARKAAIVNIIEGVGKTFVTSPKFFFSRVGPHLIALFDAQVAAVKINYA